MYAVVGSTHLPARYLVNEVFGDAVVPQQRARAEPAQRDLNGRGQAGREHVRRKLRVLRGAPSAGRRVWVRVLAREGRVGGK